MRNVAPIAVVVAARSRPFSLILSKAVVGGVPRLRQAQPERVWAAKAPTTKPLSLSLSKAVMGGVPRLRQAQPERVG